MLIACEEFLGYPLLGIHNQGVLADLIITFKWEVE